MKLRPRVQRFSEAMERKLRIHDADRGTCGWLDDSPEDLLERVLDEYIECRIALSFGRMRNARKEAVDIANFAMMVFDTCSE